MGVEFQALTWETVDTDDEHLVSIFGKTENGKSTEVKKAYQSNSESDSLVIHPRITCDVCNMNPIQGKRYWHMCKNYDICEKDYNNMTSDQRKLFICISFSQI